MQRDFSESDSLVGVQSICQAGKPDGLEIESCQNDQSLWQALGGGTRGLFDHPLTTRSEPSAAWALPGSRCIPIDHPLTTHSCFRLPFDHPCLAHRKCLARRLSCARARERGCDRVRRDPARRPRLVVAASARVQGGGGDLGVGWRWRWGLRVGWGGEGGVEWGR